MSDSPMRVGDARTLKADVGLPAESVDCIITSPPYWRLKRYADDEPREIGHEPTRAAYLAELEGVFRECYELSKPTGVMWLVLDTLRDDTRPGLGELIGLPFEVAEVARHAGWRFQEVVIWEKNKTLPYSGAGKLRNLIEYVLFLTKSREFKHRPYRCAERHMPGAEWLAGWPERYHPLGKRPSNVWQIDIETQGMWDHSERLHYCPFPQELVARCIDLTTDKGDVVLDPFGGVGTVPAQAVAMGRRGYGLELNPASVATFQERVLPEFQASWERRAQLRRLSRADQIQEALTILRLRLLKSGKEMLRAVDRLSTGRASGHPASGIESVLVVEPPGLEDYIEIDEGEVARVPAELVLLGDLTDEEATHLGDDVSKLLASPPFTTFGLDIRVAVREPGEVFDTPDRPVIREFAQSRHGAFTAEVDPRLFPSRPRLLTTIDLPSPIQGDKKSAIDHAHDEAERRLLEREWAEGGSLSEIAARVGLPQAELHGLLLKHGLVEPPRSFGISLPNQLAMLSD